MPGVEGRLFDGDNDAVAAVISPFAPVPDFVLLYGTAMHKTPLDIPMLMKYKGLLRAVFRIHHRLTFAEKDMTVILYKVADLQKNVWPRPLTGIERTACSEQIGKRLRTMFSHINTARHKNNPQWVSELLHLDCDVGAGSKKKKRIDSKKHAIGFMISSGRISGLIGIRLARQLSRFRPTA